MSDKWDREIVENVTKEGLASMKIRDFSVAYESVINGVEEKRKTVPGYRFTDVEFPPTQSSLSYSDEGRNDNNFKWRRMHEISKNPTFLKDGYSREDVVQGHLADCYLLSGLAAVAHRPKAIRIVVPKGQGPEPNRDYMGVYHFRFWQFGTWVDVVVDDWLPCEEDSRGVFGYKVAYGYSKASDEFWISLAEKAYAKLHGSFEAIKNGLTMDALEDLTGGLAVRCLFDNKEANIMRRMRKAVRNGSFVSLGISGTGKFDFSTGLQSKHSYSVTLAEKIKVEGKKVDIFRVRNPWGLATYEWKLDWSDRSEKWSLVSEEDKKRLKYPAGDGEWYMSYEDITKHFDNVTICTIGPDFDEDGVQTTKGYYYSYVKGMWVSGVNAGGTFQNSPYNFLYNPQYLIRLSSSMKDPNKTSSVSIGLMQRYTRLQKEGRYKFKIGYRMYEVHQGLAGYLRQTRQEVPFSYHSQLSLLSACDDCKPSRELSVMLDFEMDKDYLFLPFTGKVGQEEDFLIRIYSEDTISILELN